MPTLAQKKVVFYAKPELVALLESESAHTGASVSEVCRRAVIASLKPAPVEKSADVIDQRNLTRPPVLFAPKVSA
jgi:hypothetical protein